MSDGWRARRTRFVETEKNVSGERMAKRSGKMVIPTNSEPLSSASLLNIEGVGEDIIDRLRMTLNRISCSRRKSEPRVVSAKADCYLVTIVAEVRYIFINGIANDSRRFSIDSRERQVGRQVG